MFIYSFSSSPPNNPERFETRIKLIVSTPDLSEIFGVIESDYSRETADRIQDAVSALWRGSENSESPQDFIDSAFEYFYDPEKPAPAPAPAPGGPFYVPVIESFAISPVEGDRIGVPYSGGEFSTAYRLSFSIPIGKETGRVQVEGSLFAVLDLSKEFDLVAETSFGPVSFALELDSLGYEIEGVSL